MVSKERQQHIENAVDYYLTHKISVTDCAKKYGIHRTTLGQHIKKRDPQLNTYRTYGINEHFFDNIDTEEKAYILGFFTADGCIKSQKGAVKIALSVKDIAILEQMRLAMQNEKPIKIVKPTKTAFQGNDVAEMTINSVKIYSALMECGFTVQKTCHEVFCEKVPAHLRHHYIRGIFDGDGWFSYTLAHSTKELGFGMGYSILTAIRKEFCNIGVSPKYTVQPYKSIFRYRVTSTKDVEKIYDYLYKDATIFLKRKHDKLLEFCRLKISSQKS